MSVLNPVVDPVRFSTSWLFKANVLCGIRALISLYIFTSIFTILGLRSHLEDRQYFSYFTSLTFWGLAFYFAVAAFHSGTYWRSGKPALAGWPVVLQQLHGIYYTTITVYPYLVTIVFWGVIYDGFAGTEDVWSNVSQHALNSVFSLFELVFARTEPLPWIHLLWIIIILALYLGVAFITHATEHFWVYAFLNNNNKGGRGRVAAYIFAILVGAIVVFVIVKYLILLRKWITETKLGKLGRLEHRGGHAQGDEEAAEYRSKEEPMSSVA